MLVTMIPLALLLRSKPKPAAVSATGDGAGVSAILGMSPNLVHVILYLASLDKDRASDD